MQKVLVIHDFMLADENLKGAKLLVYAFIYSYSQIPDSQYYVKWDNACKFLGISKSTYFDALRWLIHFKYIDDHFAVLCSQDYLSLSDRNINKQKVDELTFMNGKYYTNEEISKIAQYKWVK